MCIAKQEEETLVLNSDQLTMGSSAANIRNCIQIYREKTVQCLILSNYMQPVPYTIVTLHHYILVELSMSKDGQNEIWALAGLVMRLALRMGYHRDGSHFPKISVFDAEMRRRVWALIVQQDVVLSAQVGLPRMITETTPFSDTQEPRNLLNEDFDENTTELPASRPDSFQTYTQFLVAKKRVVVAFGMVSEFATHPNPYAKVMEYDKRVQDSYHSIPEGLKVRSMSKSMLDDPSLIAGRIFIVLVYHKAQCVLHRRYMLLAKTDPHYTYSRTTCITAALQMLEYQSIFDQENQPGGRFRQDGGKSNVDSSMVRQEFLLATTILCLVLNHDITTAAYSGSLEDITVTDHSNKSEVMNALNKSYSIWLKTAETSREARKACEVIKVVLSNAEKIKSRASASSNTTSMRPSELISQTETGVRNDGEVIRSVLPGMAASSISWHVH